MNIRAEYGLRLSKLISCLVMLTYLGCSKSIISIGPFEGEWSGDLYSTMTDAMDRGTISFTVASDRTLDGYGEVLNISDEPNSKWYELSIKGIVKANGALECQCDWSWVVPDEEVKMGRNKVEGSLNPALNYGKGHIRVYDGVLTWIVQRRE